jgi:hypothetical protein
VASLVRGQYFERNTAIPNARLVLTDFRVDQGANEVIVRIEYANGGSYGPGTFTR